MTRIPPLVVGFVAFCAAMMAVHTLLPVGSGLQGISFQAAGIAAVAGTGLGLATVYAIAERAGGTVAVESDPGRGTRFTLTFPCVEPAGDEDGAVEADRPQGTESVLLVEDEPSVRALVARMLEAHGYEVTAAESAEEALELLQRGGVDPDLVLSDLMMPGLGGAGLAARLEELRPGQRLLFISGYSDVDPARLAGHRLVPKPFTVGELTHAVREALAPVAA